MKIVSPQSQTLAVTGDYKPGVSKTVDKSVMDFCLSHIN
jgi:hypothetical protein